MKKHTRVSVRIEDELKNLVRDIVDQTGISETTLVEATLKAVCDYYQQHGEITLPPVIIAKSELKKNLRSAPRRRCLGGVHCRGRVRLMASMNPGAATAKRKWP